jgi:cytochrome c oxidase subunit 3
MNVATLDKNAQQTFEGERIIQNVGMVIALVSFAMLFLTLMLGFAIYRFTAPVWPPQGMGRPSLFIPTLSTLVILSSSFFYQWFLNNPNKNKLGLNLTFVAGLFFMGFQTWFWMDLHSKGVYTSSGIFASIIYAFTWIHAAHILLALGLLVWMIFISRETNENTYIVKANSIGKFWHFLGIVWLIMFVTIFVL